MTDYTIQSFKNGKKTVIGIGLAEDIKEIMEDHMNNSHSSAYSSLTNSTNEISDPQTIVVRSPSPGAVSPTSTNSSLARGHLKDHHHQQQPAYRKQIATMSASSYGGSGSGQKEHQHFSVFHQNMHGQRQQVTDLSNISGNTLNHDSYSSSMSSSIISGVGSSIGPQKVPRSSKTIIKCESPNSTSTSIEIRNIIDDYNATLRRATKEIKGKHVF